MNIQWFPGHMAKARNEIIEKLKLVDIVFVLVDARIPYSSQNPMLKEVLKNKPQLVILTKFDMADSSETQKWQDELSKQGKMSLAVDSLKGVNIKKIESCSKLLLQEKIAKDIKRGMKARAIRAMIVGIPNVGKSTLINKLVNKKVTNVGNMPGVTKAQQWIRINQNIELLDTPGVLWPKFDEEKVAIHLALTGAIKSELLKKEQLCFYLLDFLKENYLQMLINKYHLDNEMDNVQIVEKVMKDSGNITDYERGYDIILNDFKNGRIGKITLDKIQ